MRSRVDHSRVLVGAAITLPYIHRDQHGEPDTITPGDAAVAVTRVSDGQSVTVGSISATEGRDGWLEATIAAGDNTLVDDLDVTWTVNGTEHKRNVAVVGAMYFAISDAATIAELADDSSELNAERKRRARMIAEAELERITERAFVPRFNSETFHNDHRLDTIVLNTWDIREIIAVAELDFDGNVTKQWTVEEIAELDVDSEGDAGIIRRLVGDFRIGRTRIDYRHGLDLPPGDLVDALIQRWVYWLTHPSSGIPDRAISYSSEEGSTFRLATPDAIHTGDPHVDAVYHGYRLDQLLR